MNAYSYFPSVIYREELPDWVGYTLQVAQKYYAAAQYDNHVTQTSHMADDPDFKFLVDYLILASGTILREQGYDADKYELYVAGLWGQDVKCDGGTDVHIHKNSQICGWLFLETPEGGSYPIYHDPRMNKKMIELDSVHSAELTNASSYVHFNNIRPGTILMANSWMQHQLTANTAQTKTKSIHFIISHRERSCSTC